MESPDSKPTQTPAPGPEAARPAPRRKAPPRAKTAAPRRPAPKRKTGPRRPASAKAGPGLWTDLVAGRASAAGAKIVRLSRDGAVSARRTLEDVKGLSKKTARRLARDWQAMSPRRRARLVATLVAALGAAAVPLVRKALK